MVRGKLHADDTPVLAPSNESRRPNAYGPMCATIDLQETQRRRRYGSTTHQIAKASCPRLIWATSPACCKRMVTRGPLIPIRLVCSRQCEMNLQRISERDSEAAIRLAIDDRMIGDVRQHVPWLAPCPMQHDFSQWLLRPFGYRFRESSA